jgi:HK97 family phage prohead protease
MPTPKTTFKIFAPLLKTSIGPDGKKRLHGVASSTIKDRHGDTMSVSALADMERTAAQNMTIFLNHSYDVPEDVAGSVERAGITRSEQDPDIHDLAIDVTVNESNERAVKAWEAIDGGTKLGLSIGAMIPDGGATREKSGAYTIDHVELLETSLVGVPANPRSWVEYAVKALSTGMPNGTDTTYIDGEMVVTDHKDVSLPTEETEALAEALDDDVCNGCGGDKKKPRKDCTSDWHEPEEAEKSVDDEDEGQPTFEGEDLPEVELVTTSSTADPQDTPEALDEADPDITDATVSVETEHAKITVDTGNRGKTPSDGSSQEAQASAPENEDEADEANPWSAVGLSGDQDIDAALHMLEPTVVASLKTSTDLLKAVTRELTETKEALKEAEQDKTTAEAYAQRAIHGTARILTMISNLPMGRRAVVAEARKELSTLSAVYGEEFMADLKKG